MRLRIYFKQTHNASQTYNVSSKINTVSLILYSAAYACLLPTAKTNDFQAKQWRVSASSLVKINVPENNAIAQQSVSS